MLTAYALVAMWVAFFAGNATHEIMDEAKKKEPIEVVTVYQIGVDYAGNTVSTCMETKGEIAYGN